MAPDIPNGFIVNGIAANNSWTTRIQSVLSVEGQPDESAYLSQECRNENVPFMTGHENKDIFQTGQPNRFLTCTKYGFFMQFPELDGPTALSDLEVMDLGGSFIIKPYIHPEWRSEVHCREVPAETIPTADLVEALNERTIPAGHIHVRIRLDDGRVLHFPAGYINFSNREMEPARYVQTISGDVLFPVEQTLVTGYLACAMAQDGRSRIEFVTKAYGKTSHRAPSGAPLYQGLVNYVIDVDGEASFYRYL